MNYDDFVKGKDIPTIRRLDYIVQGTNNMESGYLYAALRNMSHLKIFNRLEVTDERKEAEFNRYKIIFKEKLDWVNDWMTSHGRDIIFTDVNDWRAIGADYDYFWELRTKEQFEQEEADARAGKSGRKPVNFFKQNEKSKEDDVPSLDD